MKKFSFYATLIFLMTFMLTACETESGKKDSSTGKVSIVTTIYPQYDWIKNILGEYSDKVDLKLLIKNGTDLHSYKTSAQDIAAIAKADMVVYVGGESDDWIKKALEATPKAGRIQVNLMDVLGDRVKEEEIVEGSPRRPRRALTQNMANSMPRNTSKSITSTPKRPKTMNTSGSR